MNVFKRVLRIISYVLLTFSLVALVFCACSSDKLDIISYTYNNDKITNPFTCLVISDYHHRSLNFSNGNMIDILKKQKDIDYVFFTGDLIDTHTTSLNDVDKIFDVANELTNKHCYFVTGNHEEYAPYWEKLQTKMLEKEIKYLNDEEVVINDIHLYGLQDARFKTGGGASFKKRESEIKKALDNFTIDSNNFNILLDHRPENFKMIADNYKFDLVLSGHTHGGQFRLGNWIPSSAFLEEGQYMGGKYTRKDTTLYVSRGLGYSAMFPLRVNCNPEIIKITVSK